MERDPAKVSRWTDEERATWTHGGTLSTVRGWWSDSDCVIVAGGPSALEVDPLVYAEAWTITCNRAAVFAQPDFALCVEPRKDAEAWAAVAASSPAMVLSHIERPHPRTILTGSKKDVRPWIYDSQPGIIEGPELALGQSTFFAMSAAIVLGFQTIGVIGLDLTEDRYPNLRQSESAYLMLRRIANAEGRRIINLSPITRLRAIPAGRWDEVRGK